MSGVSFVILRPKLGVFALLSRYSLKWPKFGMSPEKWPKPRKQNYLGWVQWDSCGPRCTGDICPFEENRDCKTHSWNWLLATNNQTLWSKLYFFVPSIPLRPCRSMLFNTEEVSLVPLYEGIKSFAPSPKKMDFWPKNGRIWPAQNWHFWSFWAKYLPFWPIWCHARQKQCKRGAYVVFGF